MTEKEFAKKHPYLDFDFEKMTRSLFTHTTWLKSAMIPVLANEFMPDELRDKMRFAMIARISCILGIPSVAHQRFIPIYEGKAWPETTVGAVADDAMETIRPYLFCTARAVVRAKERMLSS